MKTLVTITIGLLFVVSAFAADSGTNLNRAPLLKYIGKDLRKDVAPKLYSSPHIGGARGIFSRAEEFCIYYGSLDEKDA